MDVKEKVSSWLKTLNDKKGESFALDDKNQCKIFYKEGIVCTLEVLEAEGKFYLYAPLIKVPAGAEVLRQALEINLFQIATAGSVVAIDKNSDTFIMSFVGNVANFDTDAFFDRLCIFLTSALSIREMLSKA